MLWGEESVSEHGIKQGGAPSALRIDERPHGPFTIVYGEPIPDDLRALAADLVPAGFRLLIVGG
jgi:hypothetical protein